MESKLYLVTYEVTFSENYTFADISYKANTPHLFYMLSDSADTDDQHDDAYNDIHRRFGCILDNSYVKFLPLSANPVIIKSKEVQP